LIGFQAKHTIPKFIYCNKITVKKISSGPHIRPEVCGVKMMFKNMRLFTSKRDIGIMIVLSLFIFLLIPTQAHSPSDTSLSFDQNNHTLSVTITHTVSDPSSHYVARVDVIKNDLTILSKDYTSQPSSSKFTYIYPVNASAGDVLKAKATCSIAGSRTGELTVPEMTTLVIQSSPILPLNKINLPKAFNIQIYAQNLSYPRSLALGENGTVFVGTRLPFESIDSGNTTPVYAIQDLNGNGFAEENEIKVVDMLKNPNGVAYHEGDLYVAEIDRIVRYDEIEANLDSPPKPVVVANLPYYIMHGWRYIAFGPDGKLYVAVGANCNVCEHKDDLNATIIRMDPDGNNREIYAKGVRNSVGMDWSPDGELWFTDNGRDLLGNDVPSDELNHAPIEGLDFGFPFCHSGSIPDPDLGSNESYICYEKMPPAWALGPHVAPLGMRFYQGSMFPAEYRNKVFIAEHGSWNRDMPIGYRLVTVEVENNTAVGHEIFAEGWLQGSNAWGRPVDVQPLPDGSLLVSDDQANVIYRITYAAD
jgi:glucose/arabinose dehydrogenase